MREALAARTGQRLTVQATVIRRGTTISWLGVQEYTVCLGPVQTLAGETLAGHVWLKVGKRLAAAKLHVGDVVQLDARVKPYKKCCIRRPGKPFTYNLDYGLAYPTRIQRLMSNQSREEQPA
jgi:hypothetical protein